MNKPVRALLGCRSDLIVPVHIEFNGISRRRNEGQRMDVINDQIGAKTDIVIEDATGIRTRRGTVLESTISVRCNERYLNVIPNEQTEMTESMGNRKSPYHNFLLPATNTPSSIICRTFQWPAAGACTGRTRRLSTPAPPAINYYGIVRLVQSSLQNTG
ncbi:hypothetical protein EVAR_52633_1 [Eumeta japonica]|uniref:Uncharacterized protein n=1 Tax=Eumeta variegata TaxID=151549 RepID=A0A4C1Y0Z0_EUMVA|nr:hypothetical protein EVAR_52633_1 [Eumeta japonica]